MPEDGWRSDWPRRRATQTTSRLAEKESDADYFSDLEKETDRLRTHHKEVMEELQKEAATIARLIRSREIDRRALSATAGNIGRITWREVSR